MSVEAAQAIGLDLSDVEPRVGQWIGGGELLEPCTALDIRRWVQAMDCADPLHWDEDYARSSKFHSIIAPQSFVLATDYGHSGMPAAIVGRISHPARRQGDAEAPVRRLYRQGNRVRRTNSLLTRRYLPHDPAGNAGRPQPHHRLALFCRRS